jgi:iron(III) transport system substrate-binding protein
MMTELKRSIAGALLAVICIGGGSSWAASARVAWEPMSEVEAPARKEGRLAVYVGPGHASPEAQRAISQIFRARYGVEIDWTGLASSDIAPRILAEQRTKQHVADIVMTGFPIFYMAVKPRGYLVPILAPSTLEKGVWRIDPAAAVPEDRDWLYINFPLRVSFFVNTGAIRAGEEPKSYQDLLDPKWTGKIVVQNPWIGGTGSGWFTATHKKLGLDYMRKLARQVALTPNNNDVPDLIARNQYPIGISASMDRGRQLLQEGAPVRYVHPKEGSHLATNGIYFIGNAPHPNAAKLFLHWLFTREGQATYAPRTLEISIRKDVPQDYLPADHRYVEGQPFMMAEWRKEDLAPERIKELSLLAKTIFEEKK